MKLKLELEPNSAALRRHEHELADVQSERNYHYFRHRAADRNPGATLGALVWNKALLAIADARLNRLREGGPSQSISLVIGRLRFPLPSVRVA